MANTDDNAMDVDDNNDDSDSEAFNMLFLDVGQGDCILIRCPDKRVVMIDCGSTSQFGPELKLQSQYSIRNWTDQNKNKLDALIFTHSDRDHYNQTAELLYTYNWNGTIWLGNVKHVNPKVKAVKVQKIYFSSITRKDSAKPLYHYDQSRVNDYVYDHDLKVQEVNEVTITSNKTYCETWEAKDGFQTRKSVTQILGNQYTILSGITPKGKNWSISILAGNISDGTAGSAWDINTRSLVTLLQIGDSKALFCGDATTTTEAFLKSKHKGLLSNIDIIKIGHHGSDTSSAQDFVDMINPIGVAVSVANMEDSFKHPRYIIIKRWLDKLNSNDNSSPVVDSHIVDYWEDSTYKEVDGIYNQWVEDDLEVTLNKSETLYYLGNPGTNSYYAVHNTGFKLYRKKTRLNLWETATSGTFPWSLPQTYDVNMTDIE